MKFGWKTIVFGLSIIFVANCSQRANIVDVPYVETWKEIVYLENSNNSEKDRDQIFIRWFSDPQNIGYEGMVLYYRLTPAADPYPIIKSWNFKKMENGEYDWSNTRVALGLDDGSWFIGDIGERLEIKSLQRRGKTISVTYTFLGRNSSVSKTIFLESPPNTLEQKPYPTAP
jgi:hypothetical protein